MIRTTPIHAILKMAEETKQAPFVFSFNKKQKFHDICSLGMSGDPQSTYHLYTIPFPTTSHSMISCNISILIDCIEGFNELLCICAQEFDNPTEQADNILQLDIF